MSDIMPKIKLYVFISLITLIINIGVILYQMIINTSTSLSMFVIGSSEIIGSFIPFVDFIGLLSINIPIEISSLIIVFTGILHAMQVLIIAFMVFQVVSNVIWHPDV